MAHNMETNFVSIKFTPRLVKKINPKWSDEECIEFCDKAMLEFNFKLNEYLERMIFNKSRQ